jgi:phosphotransferase family enzyme
VKARTSPQVPPRDEALPQMSRLLDTGAVAAVLERMLDEEAGLSSIRIRYLRYRPAKRLVVHYEVSLGDTVHGAVALADPGDNLAMRAGAPEHAALIEKAAARSPARIPLAYAPELDALIQWPPFDLELPALAEPPERLRERLEQAGLELETDDLPQLVKYKPFNRAVMRLDRHLLKVYASADGFARAIHALHTVASLPVRTARCESIVPDLRIAVQSLVPGRPPPDHFEVAPQAGALLAKLHGAELTGIPLEPPVHELKGAVQDAELVSALVPSLTRRVERLMRELELDMPRHSLAPSHGGFRRNQLLVSDGSVAVIDFDGVCRAPAAADLATFIAAIVEDPGDLPKAAETLDVLSDAYGRRPPGIPWYLAISLLRSTRRPFTRFKEGWPDGVEVRLAAAEAALHLEL